MRLLLLISAGLWGMPLQAAVPTPAREITDPRSIESPVMPDAGPVELDDLDAVRSVYGNAQPGGNGGAWAPDGKSVVLSINLTGRPNLWRVPVDGGFPVQLASSDDRQMPIAVLKDERVLFMQDRGGNELYEIYSVPLAGGPVINLTNTPSQAEFAFRLSPDQRLLALTLKSKTSDSFELGVLDIARGKVRQLTQNSDSGRVWSGLAWSSDSARLYANHISFNQTEASASEFNITTGKSRRVHFPSPTIYDVVTDVAKDGRLAITSVGENGQKRAGVLNPRTDSVQWLSPTPWEQIANAFSPDNRLLLTRINADSRTELTVVDLENLRAKPLTFAEGTTELADLRNSWRPDGKALLMVHEAGNLPSDAWLVSPDGGSSRPLTRLALSSLNPRTLPPTKVVTFRSSDGTLVSGILTIPPNLKRDGSHPAVVIPHGGPTSQSKDSFSPLAAALASRGFFVMRPNFRGSTGYGLAFQNANRRDLGGGDLEDVAAAAKFLVDTGYVDRARLGINGSSYGGFMALMALGKKPGLFAAAVAERPVVDWISFGQSETTLRGLLPILVGDPAKDRALYEKQSPKTYLKNIKLPLLVLHGAEDRRVPQSQIDELAREIRRQGGVIETVFYPGEGHGNVKVENQRDTRARIVAWFEKYLKKK